MLKVSRRTSALVGTVLALTASFLPQHALAADGGTICITVHDASTGVPITGARIFVIGLGRGEAYVRISNASGTACFNALREAPYRVSTQGQGYRSFATTLTAKNGVTVSADVSIEPNTFKTIASVKSKPGVTVAKQAISADSPLQKISPDLFSALNHIPGVNVRPGNDGLGIAASINGADSSSTSYQINGVSVGGGAALTLNSDLLARAEVDASNDTLSFAFLSPTATPEYNLYWNKGGYGSSLVKATAQGSLGQVGVAVAHTVRGADSALNGAVYGDQSGLVYRHVGALEVTGNYLSLSGPVGDWNFAGGDAVSDSRVSPNQNVWIGHVAAGFGPGEVKTAIASNPILSANGPLGNFAVSASIAGWDLNERDSYESRIIAGTNDPLTQKDVHSGYDLFIRGQEASEVGDAAFSLDSRVQRYYFSATKLGLGGDLSQTVRTLEGKLSAHRTFAHGLSAEGTANVTAVGGGLSTDFQIGAAWTNDHGTSATAHISVGRSFIDGTSLGAFYGLEDPAIAQYDCNNGFISVPAPGASVATPASVGGDVSATHRFKRWSLSISAREKRVTDTLISAAPVSATALPPGVATTTYLQEILSDYSAVGGCSGPPPSLSKVFFLRNVDGVSIKYDGLAARTTFLIAKDFSLDAQYGMNVAELIRAPAQLTSPLSPYIEGRQLPNIPLQQGSVTLDWHRGRSENLINLQLTSGNNPSNLPAFAELNAGFLYQVSPAATLSIVATNLTNSFVGYFVSPQFAVPLQTYSGLPFPVYSAPRNHSTLYFDFHYAIGSE